MKPGAAGIRRRGGFGSAAPATVGEAWRRASVSGGYHVNQSSGQLDVALRAVPALPERVNHS